MGKRKVLRILHILGGIIAFITILTFLLSSARVEFFGNAISIAHVKVRIAYALLLLVPAIAIAGATGFSLSGPNPKGLAAKKASRMKIIAGNGILVLVPAALFLAWKAVAHEIDTTFMIVQSIEYLAGIINLGLIGMNIRDGVLMKRPAKRKIPA
jgi:hypothetical protein